MTFYLKIYGCHKISFEKTSETSFILKTNSLNDVFQKQQVLSHDNFYPFGKKTKQVMEIIMVCSGKPRKHSAVDTLMSAAAVLNS